VEVHCTLPLLSLPTNTTAQYAAAVDAAQKVIRMMAHKPTTSFEILFIVIISYHSGCDAAMRLIKHDA
jgi:hypothetical protein